MKRDESKVDSPASDQPSRVKHFLTALVAGGVVDAVDLATFGPIGLTLGLLAGGAVGWWLGPNLGLPAGRRWLGAALSGLYCMTPLTSLLPVASVAAGLSSLLGKDQEEREVEAPTEAGDPDIIDVEFTTVTEEGKTR
ncbi:MAG: hypothetical protein VX252_02855 [Myxococcota bacterium]|nr:hypothetical protein [Myxococcota bacterium]